MLNIINIKTLFIGKILLTISGASRRFIYFPFPAQNKDWDRFFSGKIFSRHNFFSAEFFPDRIFLDRILPDRVPPPSCIVYKKLAPISSQHFWPTPFTTIARNLSGMIRTGLQVIQINRKVFLVYKRYSAPLFCT